MAAVHACEGCSVPGQVLVMENEALSGPASVVPDRRSGPAPQFSIVNVCAALVVPMGTAPKSRFAPDRHALITAVPVGDGVALAVADTVAVADAVAVAV